MQNDLDKGEEICFDLLQNSQGKIINSSQKKNAAKHSQLAAITPQQRKSRQQMFPVLNSSYSWWVEI